MSEGAGLTLPFRAGLHTGECEMRGTRVSGIAIHIGARVAALAGGGEVLVSSTVKTWSRVSAPARPTVVATTWKQPGSLEDKALVTVDLLEAFEKLPPSR
jgi:hypothetical protein